MKNECNYLCCGYTTGELITIYTNAAKLHNMELMYVSTLPNFKQFTFDQAFTASLNFCSFAYSNINVNSIISKEDATALFIEIQELSNKNALGEFAEILYKKGLLTTVQKSFLIQILNTLNLFQAEKPELVVASMYGLQNNMLGRTDVPLEEKALMIGMSCIAIATVEFWADAYSDKNNPWHSNALKALPYWLRKGGADLLGFAAGAAVGFFIGGPVVSAAGGTLVGGACSNAIKE